LRAHRRVGEVAFVAVIVALAPDLEGRALAQTAGYFSSGLYARAQSQSEVNAPPWTLSEHVGIDEIATDNVGDSQDNRGADLGSLFSAGATATANTARLNGILSATGVYRQDLEDTTLDRFSAYGFARSQATIIPQSLFFYVRGLADGDPDERADDHRRAEGLRHLVVQDLVEAGQWMHANDHSGRAAIRLPRGGPRNPLCGPQGSH